MPPALSYEQLPAALDALRAAQNIVIACHINPDGDTIGSMLALGMGLEQLGKRATLLSSDGIPPTLEFLPQLDKITRETSARDFDLAVVVDAGEMARVGKNRYAVESAPVLLDIDHHITPGPFGTINLLDARAAATGEIIYDVLTHLGVELTPDIAQCLLCALLTDTGSFRYMNVTPRTMQLAGWLIERGGSPNEIAEAVFENRTFGMQKLLGRAMESLQRSADGCIVWAHVTVADFTEFAASDAETEGIISAVRAVRGSEVALFFREMPSGKLRVSLRAREPHDVAAVAQKFGGGGHRLAAGCTMDGPLADAERVLVAAVHESLYRQAVQTMMDDPPDCEPPMDGFLNLDKPGGMTSHDVVAQVRRILKTKRVGHAGTLDPDALGVLVVAVGQATRLLPHLPIEPKEYVARIAFGLSTTTEDASGSPVEEADASGLTEDALQAVLPRFHGEISQIPPMVSAVHHEGKRLYELARAGVTVEREPRTVTIFSVVAEDFAPGERAEATLRVSCGGGTYIRTLCADIGAALGLPAHMKSLVREAVGPFRRSDAVSLEVLAERGGDALIPPINALGLPTVPISDDEARFITLGRAIPVGEAVAGDTVILLHRERLLALAHHTGEEWKPFKVFPTVTED